MTTAPRTSSLYPSFVAADLQRAAATGDIDGTDRITDEVLVPYGLARKRGDVSQLERLREQCLRVRPA